MHIPNGIQRIRSKTCTNGNTPTKHEGRKERALESTDENNGFYQRELAYALVQI